MKAYKGFNKDMTCRGFQFEEGKTYEESNASLCKCGFHACEMPLDVFGYYPPATSEYHEVELEEVSDERRDDSKVCAKRIKIGAKLSIAKIVKAQVEYVQERATLVFGGRTSKENGAASATGYQGAASATGKDSVAMACGYQGKARAALGCVIFLVERGNWNGETYPILAAKAAIVDGEKIKANTWYTLANGEFVEV